MSTRRVSSVLAAAVVLLAASWLVVPSPAMAAGTVAVSGSTITYTGTTGVDSVRVDTYTPQCVAGTKCVRISSLIAGSQLNEVGPCKHASAGEPNILACSMTAASTVVINLGGGNDVYRTDASSMDRTRLQSVKVLGGDGNDVFTGGGAPEQFFGDAGNDLIIPDAGSNLTTNMYTDDVNGGAGIDTVDYRPSPGSANGVNISLDNAWNDGTPVGADSDNIRSDVENFILTPANDSFTGTDGTQQVWAVAGDDVLDGGAGDDILYGEAGNDTITGGAGLDQVFGDSAADALVAGDDVLILNDSEADEGHCGPGNDRVDADTSDLLSEGCETINTTNPPPPPPPPPGTASLEVVKPVLNANKKRKKAKIRLRCTGGLACAGTVVVMSVGKSRRIAGKGRLGAGKYSIGSNETGPATVKLNRKARKVLRRTKRASVRLVLTIEATQAKTKTRGRLIR